MNLTDEELMAIYSAVYDESYYGDDEVVYGDGDYAVALRSSLTKMNEEIVRRKL